MRDSIQLTELAYERAIRWALAWNENGGNDTQITPEQFVSVAVLFMDLLYTEKTLFYLPMVQIHMATCMQLVTGNDKETEQIRQMLMEAMRKDDANNPDLLPRDSDVGL